MFILDSNVMIELFEEGKRHTKLMALLGEETLVTTCFSVHEILTGANTPRKRFVLETILSACQVLDFDRKCAIESSKQMTQLKKNGQLIDSIDVFIASICMTKDATLVTCDKDFKRIEGLKLHLVE